MKKDLEKNINSNNNIKNKITSVLFILWFVGSIMGMVVLSSINIYYSIMIIGQYFAIFGIKSLFEIDAKIVSITFIVIGLSCIIIPLLRLYPELLIVNIDWNFILPLLFCLGAILVGVALVVVQFNDYRKSKELCNVSVFATIIDYKYLYRSGGKKVYRPIYSFEYNNTNYETSSNYYSNVGIKPIGTTIEIKINPNNPKEVFLDDDIVPNMIIIIGIINTLVFALVFLYLLFKKR